MKARNIGYEDKFRAYLFSFDYKTHKEIVANLHLKLEVQK